jgi:hypothetical protein
LNERISEFPFWKTPSPSGNQWPERRLAQKQDERLLPHPSEGERE